MACGAFDNIAAQYDALWTKSAIGKCQREAVWRFVDPLVRSGDNILDLGCGTGEDALHWMQMDADVVGVDASGEMVRIARARGVDVRRMPIEAISALTGVFDGAVSNFGALNCVQRLEPVAVALRRLVRPGGFLALCVIGACCAWETGYFLARGRLGKAFRRPRGVCNESSLGVHVTYSSVKRIKEVFQDAFQPIRWYGIGLCVPPSYINGISRSAIERLAHIDRRIAHWPFLRGLADHRLLLFKRL